MPEDADLEPVEEVLIDEVEGRGRDRSNDSDNEERLGGRDFGESANVSTWWELCSRL